MPRSIQKMLDTRRGRIFIENLTAYLFIFPAMAIIFIFGIFPVGFAFFVSLHDWRRFPEAYLGIDNYVRALGSFGYVLIFWLAIIAFIYAGVMLWKLWQRRDAERRNWLLILPGAANAAAIAAFINWFFIAYLKVLEVPQRLPRTELRSRSKFIDEFLNSFTFPEVEQAANWMLLAAVIAIVLSVWLMRRVRTRDNASFLTQFTGIAFVVIAGAWLLRSMLMAIDTAITAAQAAGEELPVWSYIIFISGGVLLLWVAFRVWQMAIDADEDRRFILYLLVGLFLLTGAYLLIVYIPEALTEADDDLMQGFWVTVLYVLGTVPVQLGAGLGLAYLLFYITSGKAVFRIIYFLPYITPFAATAVVFSLLFSNRPEGPANRVLSFLGIETQSWLLEPTPINELIFGRDLPQLLEGPGLALVVIMIWSAWTYIGYDIVIFMAGLGNISTEYYEAAQIDGASGWRIFRHITLPLLSPTTFFLSLLAIIGTFQAFTQIWIMRRPASDDAVDTVGVYLYETISTNIPRYGYGSAMAFVLFGVVLLMTLFQNRILGRKVFYG
ncbi:MAG TPA: ABC transporter permease subunit [Aggregatilineales bacterium]|nr:ABC transporter permease subunit [Aggregatilineales bacterium]